jgi:hypothetical protein
MTLPATVKRIVPLLASAALFACAKGSSTQVDASDQNSTARGATGPTGPRGPTGPTGPTGATGLTFVRTTLVSPGATPADSGARLLAALAGAPPGQSTWLIKIEPGVYDLGTSSLQLRDNVDVEGSGEAVTTIRSQAQNGTVLGANCELRRLTVENGGAGARTVAIDTAGGLRMSYVTARATGNGDATIAIQLRGQTGDLAAPSDHVRAYASGPDSGSAAYGFLCGKDCNLVLSDVWAQVQGTRWPIGAAVVSGALELRGGKLAGYNGSTNSYGLWAQNGSVTLDRVSLLGNARGGDQSSAVGAYLLDTPAVIRNCEVRGGNTLTNGWGLYVENSAGSGVGVNVAHSLLSGSAAAAYVGSNDIGTFFATQMGGPVSGSGQRVCANVVDAQYRPVSCP